MDSDLDPLRRHPRFQAIIQSMDRSLWSPELIATCP